MSRIALDANASGTGVFTIASPNSDTDRTLTLPDESGDFVLSASGVISNFTSTGIDDNATSTAITIDSSQNVGIGTASPNTKLEIASSTMGDNFIRLKGEASSGTNYGVTLAKIQANWIGDANWASINFEDERTSGSGTHRSAISFTTRSGNNAGSERMRIDSNGNVLVGTTVLTDTGSSGTGNEGAYIRPDGQIGLATSNDASLVINRKTLTGSLTEFRYNGSAVGSISTNGSSTSYNTSSDYRLKENVVDLDNGIDRLKQIPVHRFNFIADPDTTVDGFMAHEVQDVVPEAITGTKDAVDAEGNPEYQGIDQSKLVPLLTAVLQEAVAKIEDLESRLSALETN
jgi:hypothetical protein